MAKRRYLGGVILSLALASAAASAQPPATAVIGTPPQPGWASLNPQQKTILAPLAGEWDMMENIRRKKWLGVAERYPSLKTEEQQRIQERMRDWAALTPEQRAKTRDSYKEFSQMPSEQKAVVKQKWEAYSNLPPEEKQRVRQGGKSAQLLVPATEPQAPTPELSSHTESNSAAPAPSTVGDAVKN
jgi:hypothetical protein